MGCVSINYLPVGTRRADVEEFLSLLGYERLPRDEVSKKLNGTPFRYFRREDYKFVSGLYAEVYTGKSGRLEVDTRTTIWRSKYESDLHNFMIKQLKKRFGGEFASDNGKGRYLVYKGPVREKAEAGCYLAFSKFTNNWVLVRIFLQARHFEFSEPKGIDWLDINNPVIVSNNMTVPFLVAALEDYFRSTYVALLKYSSARSSVFKNARLSGDELTAISNGDISIEEAVAKWMSFQDVKRICQHFKELNHKIDVAVVLGKPYRNRKESLYQAIERIVKHRHLVIHQSQLNPKYTTEALEHDVKTMEIAVKRVYASLVSLYGWSPGYP